MTSGDNHKMLEIKLKYSGAGEAVIAGIKESASRDREFIFLPTGFPEPTAATE